MRVVSLIVTALLLLSSFASSPRSKQSFIYGRWLRDDLIEIVPPQDGTGGRIWVAKDAVDDAFFCPEDSTFVCFYSDYYALAIPKDLKPGQESWEHRGVTYEVVRKDLNVPILGRPISDVLLIRVPSSATPGMRSSGEDGYFLYSRQHGVIGFGFWSKGDNGERTYWLEGEKGFGASK